MQFSDELAVHVAGNLREPVIPAGEDRKDGAERQNVVEMGHHVIGIVQRAVETGIGELDARDATDREQEDEADCPDHWCREGQRAAPHRRDPRENLDACRHRDDHGCEDEVALCFQRQANRIHVVRPDDEADRADRNHGVSHAEITEDGLLREGGHDVADDAEAGQDQDVHFRVAEEPEQVLIEDRVTAAFRREKCRAEIAVRQKHGDAARQNRQRKQQQERSDEHRPGEERHLVQRHARGAHVEDGGDEVDRTEDRRRARNVQRKDRQIHRRSGHAVCRQRRIHGPPAADTISTRRPFDEE